MLAGQQDDENDVEGQGVVGLVIGAITNPR